MGVYDCDRKDADKMVTLCVGEFKKPNSDEPNKYRYYKIYFYAGVPTEIIKWGGGEFYFCIN